MSEILDEAHRIMGGQTETIEILSEMLTLYKAIDVQQQRTIAAMEDSIRILNERNLRQKETILHQNDIISRLYDEIESLYDRLEAQ